MEIPEYFPLPPIHVNNNNNRIGDSGVQQTCIDLPDGDEDREEDSDEHCWEKGNQDNNTNHRDNDYGVA